MVLYFQKAKCSNCRFKNIYARFARKAVQSQVSNDPHVAYKLQTGQEMFHLSRTFFLLSGGIFLSLLIAGLFSLEEASLQTIILSANEKCNYCEGALNGKIMH